MDGVVCSSDERWEGVEGEGRINVLINWKERAIMLAGKMPYGQKRYNRVDGSDVANVRRFLVWVAQ